MNSLETVKKFYELASKGENTLDLMTNDIDWVLLAPKDHIPYAGVYKGKDQYMEWLQVFLKNVEILEFPVHEFIDKGDQVVAMGHERIRVKTTGREARYDWAHVWTLRDGKLASYKEYIDSAAVLLAFKDCK